MTDRLYPGSDHRHRTIRVEEATPPPSTPPCDDAPVTLRTGEGPPASTRHGGHNAALEGKRINARIDHAYLLAELMRFDDDGCED
jgi:hypothetical protein